MFVEPLSRFTNEQLDAALDEALSRDEVKVIWQIVEEMERRGQVLDV